VARSGPTITDLWFDDDNEDKLAQHGLSRRQVLQVLENEHLVVRNRKGRRAPYLLVGRDHGGMRIAVPIEPTRDPMVWRPVTAWRCKESERARLDRR
jgi:uncharacterized DUF497 family protein